MKKVLIIAVALVMCSSLAFAQSGGHIGIYSDNPGWSDCNLVEFLYNSNAYVVHTTAATANTSQFKVQDNWVGPTVIKGSESFGGNLFLPSVVGGDLTSGGVITYVGCKVLPHLLCTMNYIPVATSPPCLYSLEVVPDPILPSGQIEVVDCDGSTIHFATGGLLTINGDPVACPCIVGTEETSWSRIKAMYR